MEVRRVVVGEVHGDLSAGKSRKPWHPAKLYVQWLHNTSSISTSPAPLPGKTGPYPARAAVHRIGFATDPAPSEISAMKRLLLVLSFTLVATPAMARERCPPAGYDRARLEALKAAEWQIADERERRAFAQALPACLASPDPFLRDGVAFEALSHLLRSRQLDVATQTSLINDVLPRLESRDRRGFEAPFAALVLSELVRAERLNPHFTDDMRADVLERSLAYFARVRDYRGFDEREGWRHAVAHGADLMLQLSVSQSTGRDDLIRIRDAIAMQIAPDGHFYIYGESERLARPIIFMAQRGLITEAEWRAWFAMLPGDTSAMFSNQAGLARRHNVNAFLQVIYLNARLGENAEDDVLLPGAEAALRAMP
jgi:hypothetical protein